VSKEQNIQLLELQIAYLKRSKSNVFSSPSLLKTIDITSEPSKRDSKHNSQFVTSK